MNEKNSFFQSVCRLTIPVALQSMLQSSFSVVDQIMIGQLGSVDVAGVGLAGKFAGIYSVLVTAFGAAAGIMISQYLGQKNKPEVKRSFYLNLMFALYFAGTFTFGSLLLPKQIMGLYTTDVQTVEAAADYLLILSGTFLPMAGATMLATLFRCVERASYPLYASICAALINTLLNYILIFGRLGLTPLGAEGAAIATVISQCVNFLLMLFMYSVQRKDLPLAGNSQILKISFNWKQYGAILLPMLVCELFWSLGENVYVAVYGHLGTDACAAMTLTNPVQGLMIGALCGLSQAAVVLVGKFLGENQPEQAYLASKKLMLYGFAGAAVLSVVIVLTSGLYVSIYQVEPEVKQITRQILLAFALVAPFKIQNMIMGGGVLRSGGKTKYVMYIDLIGTWIFGVPLSLLSAFVWNLSIPLVYFILSLEECVRFGITLRIFKSRKWMNTLDSSKHSTLPDAGPSALKKACVTGEPEGYTARCIHENSIPEENIGKLLLNDKEK